MSQQMSSRMSRDERDLENLSTVVRPMNIVAEFAQMQNSEWLDAKMWLDDSASVSELTKCKVLCYVMKVPYFNSKFSLIIVLIVCSRYWL